MTQLESWIGYIAILGAVVGYFLITEYQSRHNTRD